MNKVTNIDILRFLDGVVQYYSPKNRMWKNFLVAIDNRTAGFSLALSDINKFIRVNSSGNVTVTIPNLEFPIGFSLVIEQVGAGTVTVASTLNTIHGSAVTSGQYKVIQLIKVEDSIWNVVGGDDNV